MPTPPTHPTAYDRDALLRAVLDEHAALAIRIAALDPPQAAVDLGPHLLAFFDLVSRHKPGSTVARAQLAALFHALDFEQQKRLFEAQLGVTIAGFGGSEFTPAELGALYDQARLLPPGHVEHNPRWRRLVRADCIGEVCYAGRTIRLGARRDAARYARLFRRAVGHAVDARLGRRARDLRVLEAGWHSHDLDGWIAAMGGYGPIPAALQAVVRAAAEAWIGPGGTFHSPTPRFEETLVQALRAVHPGAARRADGGEGLSRDLQALRALYPSSVLLRALIASEGRSSWWRYAAWPEAGGKVFFVDHYHARAGSLAAATWRHLKSWGNPAAAFSDEAWFAEIYAAWYRAGAEDERRSFPPFVVSFFNDVVAALGTGELLIDSQRLPAQS